MGPPPVERAMWVSKSSAGPNHSISWRKKKKKKKTKREEKKMQTKKAIASNRFKSNHLGVVH